MMTAIHLHGAAKERFGGPFMLDVRDAPEAVRALGSQIKGFLQFVRDAEWRILRGRPEWNQELDEATLSLAVGRAGELHFIPVPSGSKNSGVGKIVLGVALVAAAFVFAPAAAAGAGVLGAELGATAFLGITYGQIALFGAALVFSGVSQLLAGTPSQPDYGKRERTQPSALFNGPVNLTEPGNPWPLAYGRKVRVGSVVVNAGIYSEQLLSVP